ncbi:hypothetical protein KP806_13585 [Paenibacillus sp. N4]|nr:hypothetical protein [Paenibacillus vietnamensis]
MSLRTCKVSDAVCTAELMRGEAKTTDEFTATDRLEVEQLHRLTKMYVEEYEKQEK